MWPLVVRTTLPFARCEEAAIRKGSFSAFPEHRPRVPPTQAEHSCSHLLAASPLSKPSVLWKAPEASRLRGCCSQGPARHSGASYELTGQPQKKSLCWTGSCFKKNTKKNTIKRGGIKCELVPKRSVCAEVLRAVRGTVIKRRGLEEYLKKKKDKMWFFYFSNVLLSQDCGKMQGNGRGPDGHWDHLGGKRTLVFYSWPKSSSIYAQQWRWTCILSYEKSMKTI